MAHILVVDDDGDLCALLKTALERDADLEYRRAVRGGWGRRSS